MSSPAPRRRPPAMPRPFFTLAIVYIFGFFLIYALALIAPALLEVQMALPPGIEQDEAAQRHAHQAAYRAAQEAASGRIGLAFLLSLGTVILGVWSEKLPGFRDPLR